MNKPSWGITFCSVSAMLMLPYYIFLLIGTVAHWEKNPHSLMFIPLFLYCVAGIGLYYLAEWARKLILLVSVYNIVFSVVAICLKIWVPPPGEQPGYYMLAGLIDLFYGALILLPVFFALGYLRYFPRDDVKAKFKQ